MGRSETSTEHTETCRCGFCQKRYGGPWQEFRAWLATVLFGLAHRVHWQATSDLADELCRMSLYLRSGKRP